MSFSTLLRFSQYQLIARVPWMLPCKHNNRQRFWSTFKTKCCISSSLIERESERERDRERGIFFFFFVVKFQKRRLENRQKIVKFRFEKRKSKIYNLKKKSYSLIYIEYHISYTQTLICMLQKKTLFLPSNGNVSPWFWIDNE